MKSVKPAGAAIVFLSSAALAFGIYNVHAVSGVTEGGVLGATLLLYRWFGISPAVTSLVLNTACYAFGWRTFGKPFLVYSGISALGYAAGYALWEQFPPLFPGIAAHPLAAAILGSLFVGIFTGLCVRVGGATTGDDALAMSLAKRTGIPIQRIYLVSDLTILLLSLSYIPASRIIWSLLTVLLSGQIIGWMQKSA